MRSLASILFVLIAVAGLASCEKDTTMRKQVYGQIVDSNNVAVPAKMYVLHVLSGDAAAASRSSVSYYFPTDSAGYFRLTFAEVEPSTLSITYKDELPYTGKSLWQHPIDFTTELDAGVIKEQ
jgi:hypothetical protein